MTDKEKSNPFVESNQAERIEAKRERTQDRAAAAVEKSNALHTQAKSMASVIPFGQPILVGHHSERRDRNYRGKITSTFDRSFQEQEKADHLANKAETIGTGGISSTAPDALEALKAQLEKRVNSQEFMKKVNRQFKKGGIDAIDCMSDEQKEKAKANLAKSYRSSDRIFESYSLSNNNANIRRIRQRIADLERLHSTDAPDIGTDDFHMFVDEGRVQFKFFSGKPNDEARKVLKGRAFKWSRYSSTWVRKATGNAIAAGKMVASELSAMDDIY